MDFDSRFLNVILLGLGFLCVFTSFQTMCNIEETVLSIFREKSEGFDGYGYISLAIIYAMFALSNWFAPSVISLTSAKIAMILGGIIYGLFIISFLVLKTWLLYLMSALLGFGAAIIWTGQGNYLIMNSDSSTIGRNSGVFWAIMQCSMFFGNIFVYFQFQDKDLSLSTINIVFIVLGIFTAVGIGFLCTLRPPKILADDIAPATEKGALIALKNSFKLFTTKEMLLLLVTFFYTGIELSFISGIYSTSIGFTLEFKEMAKSLVGLSGVFLGLGGVVGGVMFSITGSKLGKWGRDPIVVTGFLIHVISFFLIFINLPNEAPMHPTPEKAYIECNQYIALLCSFFLGFGDSCFNTQIYSMLGSIWSADSAPAVAIFKFVQSLGAAASFFYGKSANLQVHLSILLVIALVGTATFCYVEWIQRVKEKCEREVSTDTLSSKRNGPAAQTVQRTAVAQSGENYPYLIKPFSITTWSCDPECHRDLHQRNQNQGPDCKLRLLRQKG